MYPEALPEGGKGPLALLPDAGLAPWSEVGTGPIRGAHRMGGLLFVVSGQELYTIDPDKNAMLIGTVSGTRDVRMIDDETTVLICADAHVYAATASSILEVMAGSFNGAAYQDGYGILTKAETEQFYITNLDDLTVISPVDFSTADAFADINMGCISDHRQVSVFGKKSIEIFDNTGAALFPFERTPGGFIERGCIASNSIDKDEHRVLWLGDDKRVYMTQGYQQVRISTAAIELLIAAVEDPASANGFVYKHAGHSHYVLNFATLSIAYDLDTGRWRERVSHGENRWRGHCYAQLAHDLQLVGDFENGKIYELSAAAFVDDDDAQPRIFTSGEIDGEGGQLIMDELELCVETGVGTSNGDDADPSIEVRWSDNGGRTWSNPVSSRIGQLGEYGRRVTWNRLGMFRQRVLEFSMRANVKLAVTKCRARIGAAA